jgi:hypothetical protein
MAGVGVRVEDFRLICGRESIRHFELPIRDRPPAYAVSFCARCGSPVPDPPSSGWFEIAAGLLDQDPGLKPDKHIYVEGRACWFEITDRLKQYSAEEIAAFRRSLRHRVDREDGEDN